MTDKKKAWGSERERERESSLDQQLGTGAFFERKFLCQQEMARHEVRHHGVGSHVGHLLPNKGEGRPLVASQAWGFYLVHPVWGGATLNTNRHLLADVC